MKVLARNIPITLSGRKYICDILLGLYASTSRPAIMLAESRPESMSPQAIWDGSPIAVASTNAPEEYITHLSKPHFTAKDWSENEGLWEQLMDLLDEDGFPLFVRTRCAITLGFCKACIFLLGPNACEAFKELLSEKSREEQKEASNG